MENKLKLIALSLVTSAILIGCNGESSDSTATQTGTFVDAPVSGLNYTTTSGLSGDTDSEGHFNYQVGDSVTFKVGSVELGSSVASDILTPLGLANYDTNKSARIAYILQNLDTDGNSTNDIIKLPTQDQLQTILTSIDLNNDNNVTTVMKAVKTDLKANTDFTFPDVNITEATINMNRYITENNITIAIPNFKLTTEWLNTHPFYVIQPGDYHIKLFKDGVIYYGGDVGEDQGSADFDEPIDFNPSDSTPFSIDKNGLKIHATDDGDNITFEIEVTTPTYIKFKITSEKEKISKEQLYFYDKEAAKAYVKTYEVSNNDGFGAKYFDGKTIYWLTDEDPVIYVEKFKDGVTYSYLTDGKVDTYDGKEVKAKYSVDANHILTLDMDAFGFDDIKEFIKVDTIEETSNGGLKIHLCSDGIEDDADAYELVSTCDGLSNDKDYFFTNLQDAQDFVKENY